MTEPHATGMRALVEDDFDVMAAVGGPRGIVEATIPTILFLVLYTLTHGLNLAVGVSVVSSLAFIVIRALQRIPVTPAFGGLFAIALSAFVTWRSGEASNFFVWGLLTNAGYGAALLISILVRWPALGLLIGFLRGDATGWRHDPDQQVPRRRYLLITWMWLGLFLARLAVQGPLYLAHATEALGIARLFMGVPLFALTCWFTWLLVKGLPEVPVAAAGEETEGGVTEAPGAEAR